MKRNPVAITVLSIALLTLTLGLSARAAGKTFAIEEPFGLDWGPDRVTYALEFAKGKVVPAGVRLTDAAGQAVPVQLSDIAYWPDGKSVKTANVSFMVTLTPNQKRAWTLTADRTSAPPVATDLQVTVDEKAGTMQLQNGRTGIRLAGGNNTFAVPTPSEKLPAPIQAVRLSDGTWIGKGWWQTDVVCTGYTAEVTAEGPVFARARLRYEFAGGKVYAATVELNAGQDLAVIAEEYNLSEGNIYPMTGLPGIKPDVKYAYVRPTFDSPDRALLWDWWAQTMAKLPSFNGYCFSLKDGLEPDSADFTGRSQYGNLLPGDGGLKFDKDGRFAYINGYPQWGDEEGLYIGLYNSKRPARQLAVIGLRPSQWQHPDINPHPDAIIKQYVQTTCLAFERRTNGDVFFRAPADLGKRVYGIGGVERTLAKHLVPDRSGPRLTEKEEWGSELMLRHVRLGRLELDAVRNWVLEYPETSKYPRQYVPEGDRVRYESRRTRKSIEETKKELDARTGPTDVEKKYVTDAIASASILVRHFAQIDKGHMDYGIEEGVLADLAEDALASPACTPEQARELRKWLAAITYFTMHKDFVPPREAGFGWGSANMMAQVQCRACRIAALLPHHPQGKAWRNALAKVVTLYLEDQVNEAGVTLECPHYGGMAIMMPAMGLAALSSCGDVDLARAQKRLRAAALTRLGILLPPDVRGGIRSQCPEGDGYYDGEYTFAALAGFFQKRDPELSRNLAWGVKECGGSLGGHSDSAFKLFDVGVEPLVPRLASTHYRGHGFVMRNGFPRADEAYLQVYAGSFSWGHGHNDRGTWVLYAKGAPLMMDFAAMYTPQLREIWLHPGGLTFNPDETIRPAGTDPKDDWWRLSSYEHYRKLTVAPFTMVEIAPSPDSAADIDRLGEVTAFKSTPRADYAKMQRRVSYLQRVPYMLKEPHGADQFDNGVFQEIYLKNPFTWTRQYVFVKDADPMGHNYLVVRDDLPGNTELDPQLNLWALATKVDVAGQTAVYAGQHGVDLHCYLAEPASFKPFTQTIGHPCGFGFAAYYKETFKKDFREDQIQLRIPQARRDAGYFVAIVPVKQGEPAPTFETILGGKAVRVKFPGRTDTIVLREGAGEVEVEGKKLKGPAWLVTNAGGKVTVTDLAK